ncbi:MAG: HIT domain-containing protein [Chitinispirillaceae bacterium]|jgi:histidine triad (HIT) family protein
MADCIFCKIIAKQIPVSPVYDNAAAIVIRDNNPQAPVHLLAMPKKHYAGIHEVPPAEASLFSDLFAVIGKAVELENLKEYGYRLVVNFGEKTGQSVPHIHVHILSGRPMHWPPG